MAYVLFADGYDGHQNAPHNRLSTIGCNYPDCSCAPKSKLRTLKCGHTACSQCIALQPACTNDLMQAGGGSKKPRGSATVQITARNAVDSKKKQKIEYVDDETIPGCSLCNSKLMQWWARLAAVDIKSQGRKLTVADIDKNGGNYVDYEHKHKASISKLHNIAEVDNDSDDACGMLYKR